MNSARPLPAHNAEWQRAYQGVRAMVLGASGFIGRWVARSLCQSGADVALVVRSKTSAAQLFARYESHGRILEADLSDASIAADLLESLKPQIVLNLVGYRVDRSEVDEAMAFCINAQLVDVICETMARLADPAWSGVEIIHAGSALEYGDVGECPSRTPFPNPTRGTAGPRWLELGS